MAWSAPMTAVANSTFSAAQFNQFVRDNLNETAPAKATAAGSYFVGAAVNSIIERRAVTGADLTTGTTTSTTYGNLSGTSVGPSVTCETGPAALVMVRGSIENSGAGSARMAYEVSGAHNQAPADHRGIHIFEGALTNIGASDVTLMTPLTPGVNTFTARYRVSSGTGTFSARRITVVPF
ncbi:hypothetical protein OG252_13005 [Streptomyces sp. NBC_01352]|uniref:hypothetical protein n=1 Tax=Streptomyces sp. NBC_01352 TaxID=2903834 RepID=UPI002E368B7E|nr:hypothetical protein [Streptomyces sp. NBC_01352]